MSDATLMDYLDDKTVTGPAGGGSLMLLSEAVDAVTAEVSVSIHDGTGTLRTVVEAALKDGTITMAMQPHERITEVRAIWDEATADAAKEQAEFARLPGES